jgi:hypothetical protein
VVVSDAGNPAGPFYFLISPEGGDYRIRGEGTGSKSASDAALVDIQGLSDAAIASLVIETRPGR